MKRGILLLALLALGATVSRAEAGFGLGPHAGVTFSSFQKPVGDYFGTGFLFGAHGDVSLMPYLSTRLSFDYSIFSPDRDKFISALATANQVNASDITFEGGTVSIFSIYADGKGKIPTGSTVTP
jgi:hypothetical protein